VEKTKLPPFQQYRAELTPELELIHELLRPSFIFRSFELAQKKVELDQWRDAQRKLVPEIRTSVKNHRKVRTQILNAIKAIDAARRFAAQEDPELLDGLNVKEAQQMLSAAAADLDWYTNEMLPGFIHPELRNASEDPRTFKLPHEAPASFPGFKLAKIDYWFIGELDKCLDIALTPNAKVGKVGRDRIIKKVFEVGLSDKRTLDQIKTARTRLRLKK
jgi:hypothetical protein